MYVTWIKYDSNDDNKYLYIANSSNFSNHILINSTPVNESTSGYPDMYLPRLAIGPDNTVHVVWQMYDGSHYQIYYANSSNGWQVQKVTDGSTNCYAPDLLVDNNGVVHVVYTDPLRLSGGGGPGVSYTFYVFYTNSSVWPSSTELYSKQSESSTEYFYYPRITKEGNNLYSVFFGYDASIYFKKIGSSDDPTVISYGAYPIIIINPDGLINFVAINASNYSLMISNSSTNYKIWNNGVLNDPSTSMPDATQDSEGVFWIGYVNGNDEYLHYLSYGDLPNTTNISLIGASTDELLNKQQEYKGYTEYNLLSNLTSQLSSCTPTNGNCTLYINTSVGSTAKIILSNFNLTYGTQLTGVPSGLTFNLSDGTDASAAPVYVNDNVSVYNSSSGVLIAKIPIAFTNQPNYSGWTAESGVNATDNRAFVRTAPLSDANNSQALGEKTVYLKYVNTSLSKICVIDAATTAAQLQAILTEDDCTNAGGTVEPPTTQDIDGTTYYVLTGLTHSGAVQIATAAGSNNPPILSDESVTPSTGNTETTFTFNVTVTDLDNDSQTVSVVINGVPYTMNEVDPSDTTTSDGKKYSYSTQLPQGTTHYYFESNDGKDTGKTVTYSMSVGAGTPVIVSAPGFNYLAVILLFLAVSLIYYKLN